MKTLDEVIDELEDEGLFPDALHYLQDYRMLANDFAEKRQELEDEKARYQEAVKNCEAAENKYRQLSEELGKTSAELGNEPLTWEELQEMEGEPVWVEEKDMPSTWIIIWDVTENWLYPTGCDAYRHEEYGKTWQAYRKERTE